ncbi:hypothetical protein MW887_009910 [Aspergillus wentii]|nr:hypothetical protein MW887_009910 [Aspergillus wentii]
MAMSTEPSDLGSVSNLIPIDADSRPSPIFHQAESPAERAMSMEPSDLGSVSNLIPINADSRPSPIFHQAESPAERAMSTEPSDLGSVSNLIPIDADSRPSPIFHQAESSAERAISALSGSPQSLTGVDGTELAPHSAAEHVPSNSEPLHSNGQNPCGMEHAKDREIDGDIEIASTPGEYMIKSYLGAVADFVYDVTMTSKPTIMDDLPTQAQEDTGPPSLFSPGNEC